MVYADKGAAEAGRDFAARTARVELSKPLPNSETAMRREGKDQKDCG